MQAMLPEGFPFYLFDVLITLHNTDLTNLYHLALSCIIETTQYVNITITACIVDNKVLCCLTNALR